MKAAIIGLGYVGLPLSIRFARSGIEVLGLDVDTHKIDALHAGRSYIHHIPDGDIAQLVGNGHFAASSDFSRVEEVEAVIICVPTPLNSNREPDISYVLRSGDMIASHLKRGSLVVLESTTYPGATDEELRLVLEAGSRMVAGLDFHLACSSEREDQGRSRSAAEARPKVIGGYTPACLEKAMSLYGKVYRRLIPVSSCRAAEATELMENIFRSVNFALVDELKQVCAAMDIDAWEVIEAATSKPMDSMASQLGPGMGGYRIPIDPFYMTWKARAYGQAARFIELAGEVNTAIPGHVVERAAEALNACRKAVNGSRVLVVGLAYKPDVDDDRESPSYKLLELLSERGADVGYYDPYVPVIKPTREHTDWVGTRSVVWDEPTIGSFDLVLISTAHACIDYAQLGRWAHCIVDTHNAMEGIEVKSGKVWKA